MARPDIIIDLGMDIIRRRDERRRHAQKTLAGDALALELHAIDEDLRLKLAEYVAAIRSTP